MILGKHILIDQSGVISTLKNESLDEVLRQAALAAGATVLDSNFHDFGEGCGCTGVIVLAESHISIHTWPENNYAALDIFMCGDCDPDLALAFLKTKFPQDVFAFTRVHRQPPVHSLVLGST